MKYKVILGSIAYVGTNVEVEASSRDNAESIALKLADEGNVIWDYQGLASRADIGDMTGQADIQVVSIDRLE